MIRAALVAGFLASSCGYQVGGLYAVHAVRVETFDNVSERRTHEFDLTEAVVRELAARGMRVNAHDAEVTLRGRILDIRNPAVVEGKLDVQVVGSLQLRVEIQLEDREGKVRWRDERTEAVSFAVARGESLESARREVFDRLARWVVVHFEKEW